jgi:hypothetical protein
MIEDEEDDCSILQDNTGATAEVSFPWNKK